VLRQDRRDVARRAPAVFHLGAMLEFHSPEHIVNTCIPAGSLQQISSVAVSGEMDRSSLLQFDIEQP
jgi:hypothetical protein